MTSSVETRVIYRSQLLSERVFTADSVQIVNRPG